SCPPPLLFPGSSNHFSSQELLFIRTILQLYLQLNTNPSRFRYHAIITFSKMKNKRYFNWLLAAGSIIALASCSANDPISDLSLEETQVYMTDRDKTVDFKN